MKPYDEKPVKIQARMLEAQVEQGNEANADVFRKEIRSDIDEGGFNIAYTKEGGFAWFWAIVFDSYEPLYQVNPDLRPDTEEQS